jgi:glutamyl-tRNA reductase
MARLSHLPGQDQEQVQKLVRSVINKLLHVPSTRLKSLAEGQDGRLYAEALSAIFDLQPDAAADTAADTSADGRAEGTGTVLHLPLHPKSAS